MLTRLLKECLFSVPGKASSVRVSSTCGKSVLRHLKFMPTYSLRVWMFVVLNGFKTGIQVCR